MYINTTILKNSGLDLDDVIVLTLVKQQKYEDNSEYLLQKLSSEKLKYLQEKGLITSIQGKNGDSSYAKLRITATGRKILEDLQVADVLPEDITIRDWLVQIYNKESKIIGNKKRIAQGIAQFRISSGIDKKCLAFLIKTFIADDKNFQFSQKLENLFFDGNNVFDRKFKLESCRLYHYYEANQRFFDTKFMQWQDN